MAGFPADAQGNLIPCLAPVFGASLQQTVAVGSGAVMAINTAGDVATVELFAIGCDCYYVAGDAGVGLPDETNGFLFAGTSKVIALSRAQTHVRMRAVSGTGIGRVEKVA
jgi:hypothetical protein